MNKWMSRLFKFSLIIFALLAFGAVVLGNIGGTGEEYRKTVEGFAYDATGYDARVGYLNNLRYFPDIIIDFNDLRLYENQEDILPLSTIGKFHLVMSFWDVMRQSGRIKYINIERFKADRGAFLNKDIEIDSIKIFEIDKDTATMMGEGRIGDKRLAVEIPLEAKGFHYNRTYRPSAARPFTVKLGEAYAEGLMKITLTNITLNDLNVKLANKELISTSLSIKSNRIVSKNEIDINKVKEISSYVQSALGLNEGFAIVETDEQGQATFLGMDVVIEGAR